MSSGDYDVIGTQSLWDEITHGIYPDFIDPTEGITLISNLTGEPLCVLRCINGELRGYNPPSEY